MAHTKEVVTVFLRHRGKVLLLRRSSQVGTYKNRWAGVSGYLEMDPLEQAYTELQEETSLNRENISPLISGKILDVFDKETQTKWRVHPFLADLDDPEGIHLDWENQEACWVSPDELPNFETVPGLIDALRRVWPEGLDR